MIEYFPSHYHLEFYHREGLVSAIADKVFSHEDGEEKHYVKGVIPTEYSST